jgi:hypothetical protein
MAKKKRRIKTFKNWLLARDSASRISTKSNYMGFFESLDKYNDIKHPEIFENFIKNDRLDEKFNMNS